MPVAPDIYENLMRKAVWAKKHIADLDKVCLDFGRSDPYTVIREIDLQTRELVFKLTAIKPIPPNVDVRVGDILFNLRSALDHAAFYFASIQPTPPPARDVYFPVRDSAAKYASPETTRQVQAIGHHFKSVVDSVKPYKGGNDALWILHSLNNLDKHRLLLTVASVNYGRSETSEEWKQSRDDWTRMHPSQPFPVAEGIRRFINPSGLAQGLKAGDELLRIPNTELNEKPNFLVDIAINEPGIADAQPVVSLLNGIATVVIRVISDLCN